MTTDIIGMYERLRTREPVPKRLTETDLLDMHEIDIAYAIYKECVLRSLYSKNRTQRLLALLERDRKHEHHLYETQRYMRMSTW